MRLGHSRQQSGFTLIELMIALVLGLLVSAAALQIFLTSSVNSRRQQASSEVQNKAIFGLSDLQRHLRRANFGAGSSTGNTPYFMNHLTPQGGVVLTSSASSGSLPSNNLNGLILNGSPIPVNLLTTNESVKSGSNLAAPTHSDQITIQYQAGQAGLFDCQGRSIPEDFYVIERYFVRQDTTVTPNRNGLACASAIYSYDETLANSTGIEIKDYLPTGETVRKKNNLNGNGIIVIPNMDYFRVLLGVSNTTGFATDVDNIRVAYIPIPSDPATTLAGLRVVNLQLGILTHSDEPTANPQTNSDLRFDILDKSNLELNATEKAKAKYLRNIYESTVLIRNARGGV